MIVFISDLHFIDETAGQHNIPEKAFDKFLESIKVHQKKAKAKKLKIIFLGDTFDLLRTEEWFKEKEEDRPWGNNNTDKMKKRAKKILEKIENRNKDTLNLLSKKALDERFKVVDVETIYIPGNHDRLCWMINELKEKTIDLLDLNDCNNENFRPYFSDAEYGVYAIHGHELDSFNYEGGSNYTSENYKITPIGDLIATEIITKIPYKLIKKIESKDLLNEQEKIQLKNNFQEIDNIRPLSATLEWLLFKIRESENLKEIIKDTIDEIMHEFNELSFVKNWYESHDKWYYPFDTPDLIQAFIYCLQKIKLFSSGELLDILGKAKKIVCSVLDAIGSSELFYTLVENIKFNNNIHYIVMGHTHVPLQRPIFYYNPENKKMLKSIYFNTGTWRKTYYYYKCKEGNRFVERKNMNYVIIYTPKEKPNKHNLPVFETWQGTLKGEE